MKLEMAGPRARRKREFRRKVKLALFSLLFMIFYFVVTFADFIP